MAWQPIEMAPKDGTDILLSTNGDGIHVGSWNDVWKCFMDDYGAPFGQIEGIEKPPWIPASFWMPLPDEPVYK